MTAKYPKNTKVASVLSSLAAVSAAALLSAAHQAASQTPAAAPLEPAQTAKAAFVPAAKNAGAAHLPYGFPAFSRFIFDSYKNAGLSGAQAQKWYAWMDAAYQKSGVRYAGKEKIKGLPALMDSIGRDYARAKTPQQKTKMELKTGAFVHAMIKKSIPKFSLDRGFEFALAQQKGERQCYLQAILVSGLLQRAGMNVGVVMVSKSDKGQETNNGHCVALVKLSDGRDVLVDISHPVPFVAQQGLMAADAAGALRYVTPKYGGHEIITGYVMTGSGAATATRAVRPLSYPFLLSQFDYYRGERAPGGFVASFKTPEGLAQSARYLEKAVRECPQNPLAQYVLGRVYLRQNKRHEAAPQILAAYDLYKNAGWIPQGEKEALALIRKKPATLSMR